MWLRLGKSHVAIHRRRWGASARFTSAATQALNIYPQTTCHTVNQFPICARDQLATVYIDRIQVSVFHVSDIR